ncbi:uncharacterized protein [Pseudorasbora parva]|uniref:uncharacterized protein n=1 Tax=Pseudorasbora parva TaxID=51549 RepID=UPI00351F21D3
MSLDYLLALMVGLSHILHSGSSRTLLTNCGIFICSAAENEVLNHEVTTEVLTLNQCRTLRLHHATQMLRNVKAEDFPRTAEEILQIEKNESRLQEAEAKKTDSSIHCLAWKTKSCLFQRATGTTKVFHDHIRSHQWVQCTSCKNWLHFQCAGVEGDWTSKDGCNLNSDVNNILESVKVEDILTDEVIKDLEKKLQSGNILSNRMYLWKHRGFDPPLHRYYCDHHALFNDTKTEDIIQRLERIIAVPGTAAEKQMFLSEVILPEVLIYWLQTNANMCRYMAESVLLKYTSFEDKKSVAEIRTGDDTESTDEENLLIRNGRTAAEWCSKRNWDGKIQFPTVLSMEREEQIESKCKLESWIGEYDECSPAELFTFVFEKKEDYEVFWTEMVDKMKYRIFARFEEK